MYQQVFNLVVVVAGFLAAYVINQLTQRIQRLEDQIQETNRHLPEKYVQKDDYRNDIREVKEILRQIFDKLDNKQDKP